MSGTYEPIEGSPQTFGWWHKHWKQLSLGVGCFLLLLAFSLFVIFVFPNPHPNLKKLTIEDLFNSSFSPKQLSFQWVPGAKQSQGAYTTIDFVSSSVQYLVLHNTLNQTNTTLLESQNLVLDGSFCCLLFFLFLFLVVFISN